MNPSASIPNGTNISRVNSVTLSTLSLHRKIVIKESDEDILYAVFLNPENCSNTDSEGNYPLHLAVLNSYPIHVIESIIHAYPKAVELTNNFRSTPLHEAMTAPIEVVKKLISLYPAACNRLDKYDLSPLHQFCSHKLSSLDHLYVLLKVEPTLVHKPDKLGRRPWDMIQSNRSVDFDGNRLLLNADPAGLHTRPIEYKAYHDLNWQARCPMMRVFVKYSTHFPAEIPPAYGYESKEQLVRLFFELSQAQPNRNMGAQLLEYFFIIHPCCKEVRNKFIHKIILYL